MSPPETPLPDALASPFRQQDLRSIPAYQALCSIADKRCAQSQLGFPDDLDHHSIPGVQCSAVTAAAENATQLLDPIYEALEEIFHSNGGFAISAKERSIIDATGEKITGLA